MKHLILPPDTPSVIINYKEPLRRIVDGYGYQGVVTFNEEKTHTQCHICGNFFVGLGYHIRFSHDMAVLDYRRQYGLSKTTPLSAPRIRQDLLSHWANASISERAVILERLNKAAAAKGHGPNAGKTLSLETHNLRGTCPEQLLDKLHKLGRQLGRAPTQKEYSDYYKKDVRIIYRTFGSYNNAVELAGFGPNDTMTNRQMYTPEQAIKSLHQFHITNGREPFSSDLRDGSLFAESVYRRLFGTWTKAKEIAFSDG